MKSPAPHLLACVSRFVAFAFASIVQLPAYADDSPNASNAPPQISMHAISVDNAGEVRKAFDVPIKVDSIVAGPGPGELVVMNWGNSVEIVTDDRLETRKMLVEQGAPADIALSRDGKLLAWGGSGGSSYTIENIAEGTSHTIEVGDMAGFAEFSPDGKQIAIGRTFWDPAAHGAGHSELVLFEVGGKQIAALEKSGPGAVMPVFSPDGKLLAVGNRNTVARLFDTATGKLLHSFDKAMTQEIAFSPDGKLLAGGYVDGEVALWDVATGKLLHSHPSGCHEVYSVAWSPTGDVLASSGRGGPIVLWDPRALTRIKVLEAPPWVNQVRFTRDGARLLSSSAADDSAQMDRKVTVWSVGGSEQR